jgi:hypothetical protein
MRGINAAYDSGLGVYAHHPVDAWGNPLARPTGPTCSDYLLASTRGALPPMGAPAPPDRPAGLFAPTPTHAQKG